MEKTNKKTPKKASEEKKEISDKKTEKKIPEENKKSESSEKVLEKIIEIKNSPKRAEIRDFEDNADLDSDEIELDLNEFAKPGKRRTGSLDRIAVSSGGGVRIDSGWANNKNNEDNNSQNNPFEYIPKNSGNEEKKYLSYSANVSAKTMTPEEIASSWSKPFAKMKDAKFVFYESNSGNSQNYEKVFTPKNLDEEEMRDLRDKKKNAFEFQEKKMYYETK